MNVTTPSCPRCGYDLSGIASSWNESCPLDGVCSECGLDVRWAEVLNPALTIPPWSFEHAPRGRRRVRFARTFFAALRPRRFWSELRLEHPVRRPRLAVYALGMLLLLHVFAAVTCYFIEYARVLPMWISFGMPSARGEVVVSSLWPYRLPYPSLDGNGDWLFDRQLAPTYATWFVAIWAVLTPVAFLVLTDTLRWARVRAIHLVRAAAYSTTAAPAFAMLMLVVALTSKSMLTLNLGFLVVFASWSEVAFYALVLGTISWLAIYWWVVPGRYLRLPQPGLVSLAMLGLGGLGAVVGVVLLVLVRMPH